MQGNFLGAWLGGFIFWLASLQWMRLGDPSMYRAWAAMAVYTSLYFPLFLLATRATVHRLSVPLVVAAPIVWVGLEFVRAHLFTGFAWYLLGHSQLRCWPEVVQISDLVGGYGVSFLVMAISSICPKPCATRSTSWNAWASTKRGAGTCSSSAS